MDRPTFVRMIVPARDLQDGDRLIGGGGPITVVHVIHLESGLVTIKTSSRCFSVVRQTRFEIERAS